jgi:hypothetical protein
VKALLGAVSIISKLAPSAVSSPTLMVPQIGPAHAAGRQPDDRVGRFDNRGLRAIFESNVARTIENGSSHG